MTIVACYVDSRYLSDVEFSFVNLVKQDIANFLTSSDIDRVLLFPPIENYYRKLIHRVCEEFDGLISFSIGLEDARRTVVCLREIANRTKHGSLDLQSTSISKEFLDKVYYSGIMSQKWSKGANLSTSERGNTSSDSRYREIHRPTSNRRHTQNSDVAMEDSAIVAVSTPPPPATRRERRPVGVYVPRARREHDAKMRQREEEERNREREKENEEVRDGFQREETREKEKELRQKEKEQRAERRRLMLERKAKEKRERELLDEQRKERERNQQRKLRDLETALRNDEKTSHKNTAEVCEIIQNGRRDFNQGSAPEYQKPTFLDEEIVDSKGDYSFPNNSGDAAAETDDSETEKYLNFQDCVEDPPPLLVNTQDGDCKQGRDLLTTRECVEVTPAADSDTPRLSNGLDVAALDATAVSVVKDLAESVVAIATATSQDPVDPDSWDAKFDDAGNELDSDAMADLTKAVGKVKIEAAKCDYLNFSPKDPEMDDDLYGHLLEIYDFPSSLLTRDLIMAFKSYMSKGFDIQWVDDTHAIGVFSSPMAAQSALEMKNQLIKVRPISMADRKTKLKVKRTAEFLHPYRARPETIPTVARNLVAGALGIQKKVSPAQRAEEKRVLREAREKKREAKKLKTDAWEGNFGKCAMDEDH